MFKSIGIIETRSIAFGYEIADKLLKDYDVELLQCKTKCPGKFIIIICSDTQNVNDAIISIKRHKNLIGNLLISDAHQKLIDGLKNKFDTYKSGAIGIVESLDIVTGINSLNKILKNNNVNLLKLNLSIMIGGKCYFIINGDLSSVEQAIFGGIDKKRLQTSVIANPDTELISKL